MAFVDELFLECVEGVLLNDGEVPETTRWGPVVWVGDALWEWAGGGLFECGHGRSGK